MSHKSGFCGNCGRPLTEDGPQEDKLRDLINAKPEKSFIQHVKECAECVVDSEGEIWTCSEGARLRQKERKARL